MTHTIAVNGNKAGEQVFFKVEMSKENFFSFIEVAEQFQSVEDVLAAESNGLFKIK